MSPRSITRWALVYLALTVALSATLLSVAAGALAARPCMEDAACWRWPTMGNHKRGIVLRDGRTAIVGPCGYVRARRTHALDPKRSGHVPGDADARRACNAR
jgi:hypothetical protein